MTTGHCNTKQMSRFVKNIKRRKVNGTLFFQWFINLSVKMCV